MILLKYLIRELISMRIVGKLIEKFLLPFFKAYNIIYRINNLQLSKASSKNLELAQELKRTKSLLKENLVTRNGIFKRMIYKSAESAGSTFFQNY